MVTVIYSDKFLEHRAPSFHFETPERLRTIVQKLHTVSEDIQWQEPTSLEQRSPLPLLQAIHTPEYLDGLKQLADKGGGWLDADTFVAEPSYEVALLAVNAWLDGVDRVLEGHQPVFVLARPPGHHALPARGMGFCLLANGAIAAYYALQQPGIQRVAILDWDVHHGNGTQAIVENHANIAYCSLHEGDHYPYTGSAEEKGVYGNILNIPLLAGTGSQDYRQQFSDQVIPFLEAFNPDLLMISAGYDSHAADPLGDINLQASDYQWLTEQCLALTRQIVFGLEGGYHLGALADSVAATLAPCHPKA
ncbi:histone deacetylase [Candidatus Synechococcus calcipolaris G9]|uniref:Histone deacetylase n=1 Tax=Candidatus Synechococcus calcipolaris G9 TaxID=1497997 RepID=A0ABT6F265_9SYNE|nr:histone deacetylase [Candidatus Synechococcus calcipolaris]MDG2991947.1 histone deacetylase [Candidatus Synechococcus calcipolaris G9]